MLTLFAHFFHTNGPILLELIAAGKAAFRLKGKSNFLRWGVPPPTQRTVRRGTPQIAIRVKAASSVR